MQLNTMELEISRERFKNLYTDMETFTEEQDHSKVDIVEDNQSRKWKTESGE